MFEGSCYVILDIFSLIAAKISLKLSSVGANADIEEVLRCFEEFYSCKTRDEKNKTWRKEVRSERV